MSLGRDFNLYAKDRGISSLYLDDYVKEIYGSMTPYILEERKMNVTQMDVFSRLMADRIIWVSGVVDNYMATVLQAQMLYLENAGEGDIQMYIDSPGGSVKAGLSIVDVMDYIACDISTVNAGLAASMGSILLGAGTKGKRYSLRFSRTMLHQSSGGFRGNIQDAEIDWQEWQKINQQLFDLLGEYCGKTPETVKKDASRDYWMSAEESVKYGIIDDVIKSKNKKK